MQCFLAMHLFLSKLGFATLVSEALLCGILIGSVCTSEAEELLCSWTVVGFLSLMMKSVMELCVVLRLGANGGGFVPLRKWFFSSVEIGPL